MEHLPTLILKYHNLEKIFDIYLCVSFLHKKDSQKVLILFFSKELTEKNTQKHLKIKLKLKLIFSYFDN